MYAKISKKGQVTIPKAIREKLKIENEGGILFVVENNEVKIKSVSGTNTDKLAGSLKKYVKTYTPLEKVRSKIQGNIAKEIAEETKLKKR